MAVKRGRKQARRSGESSIPGYVWLLFGLVLAAGFAQFRLPYLSRKPILQQQFE